MVNTAWRRFALANGDSELRTCEIGSSYLKACDSDLPKVDGSASAAIAGLRGVLDGTLPNFSIEYPCHSPTQKRWFVMNVAPIGGPDFGVVVSHFNVTAWFERTEV
jgi:two-component system CheB/CheR fusion protein